MSFFPAERYNDLHHGRLIIDNYDFCHTRAEDIAELRKEKRK
jgi:hypothetical protein